MNHATSCYKRRTFSGNAPFIILLHNIYIYFLVSVNDRAHYRHFTVFTFSLVNVLFLFQKLLALVCDCSINCEVGWLCIFILIINSLKIRVWVGKNPGKGGRSGGETFISYTASRHHQLSSVLL